MTVTAPSPIRIARPTAGQVRARRAWTVAGLALAVLIVGGGALDIASQVAYQAIPSQQRVFSLSLQAVWVHVDNGSVTVQRAAGASTVVESSGSRGVNSPSDHEQVVGHTLVVRSSCGATFFDNHCTRNYVLTVTSWVSVVITTGQGDVRAVGLDGTADLHSDQGAIDVIGGSGTLRATSGQGDVSATSLTSQSVVANSSQGAVDLGFVSPPSHVTASSSQGAVTIGLPRGDVSYQVHASSDLGNAVVAVVNDPASPRQIRASSSEGDVDVRYGAP